MSRDIILSDKYFWLTLELRISGYFRESNDLSLRKYWIDGFMAESINNIRSGLNVYGYVWVAVDNRDQRKIKFVADIPQLLLYKNILKFDYNVCKFDIENEVLYLKIKSAHQDDAPAVLRAAGDL